MCYDRCISPRVFGIQPKFPVAEDQQAERLVEPEGGAISMHQVLTLIGPRVTVTGVQDHLK